jgi:hypothetical protein
MTRLWHALPLTTRALAALFAVALLVAGCSYSRNGLRRSAETAGREIPTQTSVGQVSSTATGGANMSALSPQEQKLVTAARDDLAKFINVSAGGIGLESIKAQQWADTSLGCPESGRMYAQVVTDGYQILLRSGGKLYDYRSNGTSVRRCAVAGGV